MNLRAISAAAGITVACCYTIIATKPIWPLAIALAALSGFNLSTALRHEPSDR